MHPPPFDDSLLRPDISEIRRSVRRWRLWLALTVLLIAGVVWGTWLETRAYERRQALDAAARRQGNLAIAVGHYLTRALGNGDAVGQYLAARYASPATDLPEQLAARARANDLFVEMAICFAGGAVLASRWEPGDAGAASHCARWLREAPEGARTHPADPVRVAGQTLVPLLTRADAAHGRPPAVIALLIDVRNVLGLMQDYRIPDETVVLVARDDSATLARWHSARRSTEQRAPEAALLPAVLAAGTLGQVREVEGRTVLVSARRVEAWPVSILIATSYADTVASPSRRAILYAAASGAATLLLAGFTYVLLRLQRRVLRTSEALGRARHRLHDINVKLESEVRARTGELEAAYRDLETFSYSVAHDVRGPLGAVRAFADALTPKLDAMGDAKASHYLQRIVANAAQMNEIADALLSLGQLARPSLQIVDIDLSALAQEVLASLRERDMTSRTVHATVQQGMVVRGDRVLVRQVLENLLGNAWKFTGRRAAATIAVEASPQADGQLQVAIRDNGEGFDMGNAPDLFKPFRRAHAAADFAGTGVGLAAVERIVRLHGGRTWIESAPGEGTSVFFTLPAS